MLEFKKEIKFHNDIIQKEDPKAVNFFNFFAYKYFEQRF